MTVLPGAGSPELGKQGVEMRDSLGIGQNSPDRKCNVRDYKVGEENEQEVEVFKGRTLDAIEGLSG